MSPHWCTLPQNTQYQSNAAPPDGLSTTLVQSSTTTVAPQSKASMATLTLQEAMASLTSMFPDIDAGTVEAVLRRNRALKPWRGAQSLPRNAQRHVHSHSTGGHMESTTEHLLRIQMGEEVCVHCPVDIPQHALHRPPCLPHRAPAPRAAAAPRPGHRPPRTRPVVPGSDQQWRNTLPADFLKVPGTKPVLARPPGPAPAPTGGIDGLSDAEMAAMFQDDAFLAALRANPEFAAYMQAEQEFFQHRRQGGGGRLPADAPAPTSGGTAPAPSAWANFKAGLSSMGNGISSRFSSFARGFRRGGGGGGGRCGVVAQGT